MSVVELSVHHVMKVVAMENEPLDKEVYSRHLKIYAKQLFQKETKEVLDIVFFSNDPDGQELEIVGGTKKLVDLVADLQNAKVEVEYPGEPELTQGYSIITITFAGKEYKVVNDFIDAIQKRLSNGEK